MVKIVGSLIFLISLQSRAVLYQGFKTDCYNSPVTHAHFRSVQYCIQYHPTKSSKKNVLWYFHPMTQRNLTYNLISGDVTQDGFINYWEENNIPPPVVVSFSFSRAFFFTPPIKDSELSGLTPVFLNQVAPMIESKLESKYGIKRNEFNEVGNRYMFGYSQGGWNGLALIFNEPKHKRVFRFKKIAFGGPAVVIDRLNFEERYNVEPNILYNNLMFYQMTGMMMKLIGVYDKKLNPYAPLRLAQKPEVWDRYIPPMLIAAGTKDPLLLPIKEFVDLANEFKEGKVTWELVDGAGHLTVWKPMATKTAEYLFKPD